MKHYFATANGLGRRLRGLAAVAALSLCGVCGAHAQAFASPVGTTWDCIISGGHQSGIAFLVFSNNATANTMATFGGFELLTAKGVVNESEGRGFGAGIGRGLGTVDTSSIGSGTSNSVSTVFGFSSVFGYWRFDERGRVIGYFPQYINAHEGSTNIGPQQVSTNFQLIESIGEPTYQTYLFSTNLNFAFTNSIYATNIQYVLEANSYTNTVTFTSNGTYSPPPFLVNNGSQVYQFFTNVTVTLIPPATSTNVELVWTTPAATYDGGTWYWVNTNIIITPFTADSTNQISFKANVSAGRRLSLVSTTPTGKVSFNGVPQNTNLADLSGNWYADKRLGGTRATEFFTLQKTEMPNLYSSTNGTGPGYVFDMYTMASSQRKAGFVFAVSQPGATNAAVGATYGSLSLGRKYYRGNTTGNMDGSSSTLGYNAFLVLP
jgi:hypothetical protein